MKTIIKVSIDSEIKLQAENITSKLGMTLNDAIRAFMHQIIINQGIPFKLISVSTQNSQSTPPNYIIR